MTYTLLFWIDAICIDQSNLQERAPQFMLMNRIYGQAKHVKVWLGGQDGFSRSALETIQILNTFPKRTAGWQRLDPWDPILYEPCDLPVITPRKWLDYYALLTRAWFRRAWIVQEFATAKNPVFFCGLKVFPPDFFFVPLGFLIRSTWIHKVIQLAERDLQRNFQSGKKSPMDIHLGDSSVLCQPGPEDSDKFNYTIVLNMVDIREDLGHPGNLEAPETQAAAKPLPLWRLCWRNRSAAATDARDKIYAYLGLSEEFLGPKQHEWIHLSPDYTKPASQVYTEASEKMISSMGNLRLLSLKENQLSTKLADLPSWVPDFSAHGRPNPFDTSGPTPWTTSSGLTTHIHFSQRGVLQVRGFKIGEVTRCASPGFRWGSFSAYASLLTCIPDVSYIRDPVMNEHRNYLQEGDAGIWEKAFDHLGQPDNTHAQGEIRKQSRVEVLWRTALTDRFAGLYPAPAECGVAFDSLIKLAFQARGITRPSSSSETYKVLASTRGDLSQKQNA